MEAREFPSRVEMWHPPSEKLRWTDGAWRSATVSPVSYPRGANEVCFEVEDASYWFAHRMDCILAAVTRHPPRGTFWDIGGGNGYVAARLQHAGLDVALVEPGEGAQNAVRRGVVKVVAATFEDAAFHPAAFTAAGAFDVLEHIEDDVAFLGAIRTCMASGGRFFATVPALPALWSDEDIYAGHFRRYTRVSLEQVLRKAGFSVDYLTPFFSWLPPPIWALRSLPAKLGRRRTAAAPVHGVERADHTLPVLLRKPIGLIHRWEVRQIWRGRQIPWGSSLLCVATAR